MSEKNTVVRSLHDVGLATWFGGSLMGAVGLNGAAAKAQDPQERLALSALGWARWAPVSAAAIGAHAVGGAGLIRANRGRLARQPGATASDKLASAQRQLRAVQWAIPATTAVLVVLGAAQGEQQRPQSLVRDQVKRVTS